LTGKRRRIWRFCGSVWWTCGMCWLVR